jgi:ABC-type bacteriocin/lantibiotic exporter with double-glycine peptidase domain
MNLTKTQEKIFDIHLYYKTYKLPIIYGLVYGCLSSYFASYVPLIHTEIVNILLGNIINNNELYKYMSSFLLYKISTNMLAGLRGYFFTKYINLISILIKKDVINKLINTDIEYFINNDNSEIIQLVIHDAKKMADLYTIYLNMSIRNIIHFIVVSYILVNKSFKLYIICCMISSIQYFIQKKYIDKYYNDSVNKTNKIEQDERKIVNDYVNKIITYRSLGFENKLKDKLYNLYNNNINIKNEEAKYYGLTIFLSDSINQSLHFILIFSGIYLNISYRIIYEFTLYINIILGIIREYVIAKNDFVKNKLPIEKVNTLFNNDNNKNKWGNFMYKNIEKCNGNIIIENLSFYYNNNFKIFDNISLNITENKITGIKGESGIGKSTLFKLILGLYKPNSGVIKIDNILLNDFDNNYYYNNIISYVGQEPELIEGNVYDNIIINTNYDRNLYNIIYELIENINLTNNNLSGGQKQRIAIARAIMRKPKILLLDEPTSALDKNNEDKFMKILKKIIEVYNITILIISHKTNTLNKCDNIIDFEKLIYKNYL